jgi:hypothetical protein
MAQRSSLHWHYGCSCNRRGLVTQTKVGTVSKTIRGRKNYHGTDVSKVVWVNADYFTVIVPIGINYSSPKNIGRKQHETMEIFGGDGRTGDGPAAQHFT